MLIVAVALDAPGRASDGWDEFKRGRRPGTGTGRLGSVAGESRYQFWSAAVRRERDQAADRHRLRHLRVLVGAQRRQHRDRCATPTRSTCRRSASWGSSASSLLAGFLLADPRRRRPHALARRAAAERSPLAAALAGCAAFCLTAVFDWMWQIPVLPRRDAAARRGPGHGGGRPDGDEEARAALPLPLRVAVRGRRAGGDRRDRDPARLDQPGAPERGRRPRRRPGRGALRAARSAQNVEPDAARRACSRRWCCEAEGDLGAARRGGPRGDRAGVDQLAQLAGPLADRGRARPGGAAVRDYRSARSLNPRSIALRTLTRSLGILAADDRFEGRKMTVRSAPRGVARRWPALAAGLAAGCGETVIDEPRPRKRSRKPGKSRGAEGLSRSNARPGSRSRPGTTFDCTVSWPAARRKRRR